MSNIASIEFSKFFSITRHQGFSFYNTKKNIYAVPFPRESKRPSRFIIANKKDGTTYDFSNYFLVSPNCDDKYYINKLSEKTKHSFINYIDKTGFEDPAFKSILFLASFAVFFNQNSNNLYVCNGSESIYTNKIAVKSIYDQVKPFTSSDFSKHFYQHLTKKNSFLYKIDENILTEYIVSYFLLSKLALFDFLFWNKDKGIIFQITHHEEIVIYSQKIEQMRGLIDHQFFHVDS